MISGTFFFSHFSLLSTSRFTCSHFFLALIIKHTKYLNYFLGGHSSRYRCSEFLWLIAYRTSKGKTKPKHIVLIHIFSKCYSNEFKMLFKLIPFLSKTYCVLNLDGGMKKDGNDSPYKAVPQCTQNEQNECCILQTGTSNHTSYILIGKDTWPQGKAEISNHLQLLSLVPTHFPLLLHYPHSIGHFPKRLFSPIYTSMAFALRYSLVEKTSGSLCFLPPLYSSPSVHWEMGNDEIAPLRPSRKCTGRNTS